MRNGQLLWDHARHSHEPLQHEPFFDTLDRVDIDNLLLTVDNNTDFMAAFEHVLGRYQRAKASKPVTIACLMAYATNNARGLKKGVVAYTLLANHVPINARIIGANEHESHYVFDVIFSNATDIVPDIHSTDTHGANQVNFGLLYLFSYQFAPRYRNFRRTMESGLYGFKHPKRYQDYLLKPIRKIKEELIVSEWPNIERILLSLALKTTTQSMIISKLSAYRRKNRTKQALWEFDNIIKSLYLLDYADSPVLRRNVQKALNRGESYHQLRHAIAYAHGGRFRVRSHHEQDLWNECAHLIANAVVHYNSLILSDVLKELSTLGDVVIAETLKCISPLAWQHINFYGRS